MLFIKLLLLGVDHLLQHVTYNPPLVYKSHPAGVNIDFRKEITNTFHQQIPESVLK